MANAPSAQYTTETLEARDRLGQLKLTQSDGTGSDNQPSRFWAVGPLFDIRANGDGLLGSTWALVPLLPDNIAEYQFSLRWNPKHSPPDAKAAWTWGEGPAPVTINGTAATFLYTFWAYVLGLPFVDEYFNYSPIFWKDTSEDPYRVFIRHNQETGTGWTALLRSFTFGWHDANSTAEDKLELLLSHEITHNWPQINNLNAAGT
ncbi:unnamed protein product, partial [Clonostachys rosea f. rosea IK726]